MFKPGDMVMCEGEGPYTLKAHNGRVYPLTINELLLALLIAFI